ncbi:MAG: hypothetical protein DPW11_01235 [bacterium]|nr:hypothetical protein [Candidatus Microgenomates bacterium CPR3]MCQ3944386.1 hypothetical protein [bacterium]RIK51315.1 MAG: hypothetical protein DCC61_03040 [Candidatus Microgenomates bacterium]
MQTQARRNTQKKLSGEVYYYLLMKKYKTALFIGRFQPFHKGHLYSLKKCLDIAERVVVAVGSSQESGTESNPWKYKIRKRMVCEVVRGIGVESRIKRICSCPDNPSDQAWLMDLKRRTGHFDVVVSNNEWVLSIFREAGHMVYESGLHNRDELEGIKVRALMRVDDTEWRGRVPREIVELFDNNDIEMIR